ncbi:MAG TPA: sigma-70 family RNA polymerase sigma factor, partial [Microthrixaceae bacterium]|nr:sigma-70 family RNA polymerase sigma factor [Microthrixaceae bacterium]
MSEHPKPDARSSDAGTTDAETANPDAVDVVAARGGDAAAMERLLRRQYPRLTALCRRMMADPDDTEDATQQALIAIVRGFDGFDGRSAFSTWCYRIATNACLDELRKRARRGPTVDLAAVDPALGSTADPSHAIADRLDIDAALATLPLEFRVPVVLRDLCGLDYAEIAEVTGTAGGTVRSRIARGRAALARVME